MKERANESAILTYRQTHRQTLRQTDRQTDGRTDGRTYRQTDRQLQSNQSIHKHVIFPHEERTTDDHLYSVPRLFV